MTFIKLVGAISHLEKNMSNRFKIATIFLLQMQQYVDHVQGLSLTEEKCYIRCCFDSQKWPFFPLAL